MKSRNIRIIYIIPMLLLCLSGMSACSTAEDQAEETYIFDTGAEFYKETDAFIYEPDTYEPDAYVPDAYEPDLYEPDAYEPDAYDPELYEQDSWDSAAFEDSDPAASFAAQGQYLWSGVCAETIEMMGHYGELPFTPSEDSLQEIYDYLKETAPGTLKNEYERELRIRYVCICDALYASGRSDREVFISMGKAFQFSEALLGEQEELFRMAEDDYENTFGSQQVTAMFSLFFEDYASGFSPEVTDRTKPGSHAVVRLYPAGGGPVWRVCFIREQAGGAWKIESRGD